MKILCSALSLLSVLSLTSGAAFVQAPAFRTRTFVSASAVNVQDPTLQATIAEVREAASAFGDETVHFANVWIDHMLEGKIEGMAAGLLDECVLDDSDKCRRYSDALTKLDELLGVGTKEQF